MSSQPSAYERTPLSNFQEQAWKHLFEKDIHDIVGDCSYEDNQLRITYTPTNAEEFTRIRRVTDLSATSVERDFKIDILVENKNPDAEIKEVPYRDVTISTIPLYTSSGFFINGVPYGARSESTLAPGWYMTVMRSDPSTGVVTKAELAHRSKYGNNITILFNKGRFSVKMKNRVKTNGESVDLWTWLKALSGSERFSDMLTRLNKLDVFVQDYLTVQRGLADDSPIKGRYNEPSIEACAEKVVHAFNRYVSQDIDYVTYLQNIVFTSNQLNFEENRSVRFKKMCGFNAAVDKQLADDVVLGKGQRLKRGTTLTAEDVTRITAAGVDHIFIDYNGGRYKLFEVSISENPTMNEIIAAIYYFGLLLCGIGKATDPNDFTNKTIKTVSTMIAEHLEKQLMYLTNRILSNYTTNASSSLTKLFNNNDLRAINARALKDEIFGSPAYNMQDETNSIAALQHSYKITGPSDLGKKARSVKPAHLNRVCSFTTPESKPVGLNLSLTLGSEVRDGFVSYPVYKVVNGVRVGSEDEIVLLNDTDETNKIIAPYGVDLDTPSTQNNEEMIPNCRLNGEIVAAIRKDIMYQDKGSMQSISPILLFVPSLNRNAGKRLTMAANAIAQARQPIKRERPWVSTGIEALLKVNNQTARDLLEIALSDLGLDENLIQPSTTITLMEINDNFKDESSKSLSYGTELIFNTSIREMDRFSYVISRLQPATNSSIKHQRVRIVDGNTYGINDIVITNNDTDDRHYMLGQEMVTMGKDIVSTKRLEDSAVAFGENVSVLFGNFEGYGYEDSVIINERLVNRYGLAVASVIKVKDTATQEVAPDGTVIKSEEFALTPSHEQLGSVELLRHMDGDGLAKLDEHLKPGQVVINKRCTQKKRSVIRPTTLNIGQSGTVINKFIFTTSRSATKQVTTANVILGNIDQLSQGDKVGGLHGNKGVVGYIVKDQDMPFTEFGTPDVIVNELGVISRTNIGQLVEALKGEVGQATKTIQFIEPFSTLTIEEMVSAASKQGIKEVKVYDGRTGKLFERKAFIGNMYFLRSSHTSTSKHNVCGLTDAKRNAISQQPIKCAGGGQRIGELLANVFRAHNATTTLDSFFTTQSDDIASCKDLVANIEAGNTKTNVQGEYHNAEMFLAFFRVLGLNISKDLQDGGRNRFIPLNDKDIDTLSLNKITSDMITASSKQSSADLFLRDTKFLKDYAGQSPMEDLKRTVYSSIELPRKVIMPLLCYGDSFLNMFAVKQGRSLRLMSTVLFKKILMSNYILLDKNFAKFPEIIKRNDAEKENLITANTLFGANALMWIFERYNLNYTIAILEKQLGMETTYAGAKDLDLGDFDFDGTVEKDTDDVNATELNIIDQAIQAAGQSVDDYKSNSDELDESESVATTKTFSDWDSAEAALNSDSEVDPDITSPEETQALTNDIQQQLLGIEAEVETAAETEAHEATETPESDGAKDLKLSSGKTKTRLLQTRGNAIQFLEHNKIEDFFVQHILIPPIAYRPDFEDRVASPIDKQLISLIGKLKSYGTNPTDINLTNIYRELFYMVVRSPKAKPGQKNIFEMIVSHENRNSKVRDTLFAKRILASGRSVIIVNPKLRLGQCRLPFSIALELLKVHLLAERHTKFPILSSYKANSKKQEPSKKSYYELFQILANNNIREFAAILNLSSKNYLEINRMFTACRNELKARLNELLLIYPSILNREPSLHKFNAMAFDASVTDGYAIELHPLACRPYNADFDGDQMAVFMPFVADAIAETRSKMDQRNNLVNPNNGKLIVELNQDMILGLYWLTMNKSNMSKAINPRVSKSYTVSTQELTLSCSNRIKADVQSGVLSNKSVVTFYQDGEKCIGFAGTAAAGAMLSENYHSTYTDCREIIDSYPVPPSAEIEADYTDNQETSRNDILNKYDGYKAITTKQIWQDIEDGTITPQDTIIFSLDGRKYYATAGRVLLNSLLPDGVGFTTKPAISVYHLNPPENPEFFELEFNQTLTSKNISAITSLLQNKVIDEVQNRLSNEDAATSETQLFTEGNAKFCFVLDRLKDVGFLMSDLSGISISLFDFRRLELTRKNSAVAKTLRQYVSGLGACSTEEFRTKMQALLLSMDQKLREVTCSIYAANNKLDYPYATCHADVLVYLNDQLKTPHDYIYYRFDDRCQILTMAQAMILHALARTDIEFPLMSNQLVDTLCLQSNPLVRNRVAIDTLNTLTEIFSKCEISMESIFAAQMQELAKGSGVSLMRHQLNIVARKFKDGRLTEVRKKELTQQITEGYKTTIKEDITAALSTSRNSNLFIMVDSGARGNMSQLMEVCGVIGTVADGNGDPVSTPIESNLLTGLNSTELFTSSLHARSILVNTQLDIPVSGELNRKLSYLTEYIKIRPELHPETIFCGTDSIDMPIRWVPTKFSATKLFIGDYTGYTVHPRWETFINKYYESYPTFNINSQALEFIHDWAKQQPDGENTEVSVLSTNKTVVINLPVTKLKSGMDLVIHGTDAFRILFRQKFVPTCNITDKVKELLAEDEIELVLACDKAGKINTLPIQFEIEPTAASSVYYRCIDLTKLDADTVALAKKHCYAKYSTENPVMLIGHVITHKFLKALQEQKRYFKSIPIFTIINCKCRDGICRRCYGMKYDTSMMPEPSELIGYQGVQAVCSTLSQMILDTHKSTDGGAAQKDIGRIDKLIAEEVSLSSRLSEDIAQFVTNISKDIQAKQTPEEIMSAVSRHLHTSALQFLIPDKHQLAEVLVGGTMQAESQDIDFSILMEARSALARFGSTLKQDATLEEMQSRLVNFIDYFGRKASLTMALDESCENFTEKYKFGGFQIPSMSKKVFIQRVKSSLHSAMTNQELSEIISNSGQQLIDKSLSTVHTAMQENIDVLCTDLEAIDKVALLDSVYQQFMEFTTSRMQDHLEEQLESATIIKNAISKLPQSAVRSNYDTILLSIKEALSSNHSTDENDEQTSMSIEPKIAAYIKMSVQDQRKYATYIKMSIWLELIDLMKDKSVLARNLELFPQALIECGVAQEDKITETNCFSVGCIYSMQDLNDNNVAYSPVKLSSEAALTYNKQIYSDSFLANTRQSIITHVVRGDDDRNSPIGQAITGYSPTIEVKPYDLAMVSTGEIRDINTAELGLDTLGFEYSAEAWDPDADADYNPDVEDDYSYTQQFEEPADTVPEEHEAPEGYEEPTETNSFADSDSAATPEIKIANEAEVNTGVKAEAEIQQTSEFEDAYSTSASQTAQQTRDYEAAMPAAMLADSEPTAAKDDFGSDSDDNDQFQESTSF